MSFKNVDYNDDDDDDDDDNERSTLEDLSRAKQRSTLENLWPPQNGFESADNKLLITIPPIMIIIIIIPGCGGKDDSSVQVVRFRLMSKFSNIIQYNII